MNAQAVDPTLQQLVPAQTTPNPKTKLLTDYERLLIDKQDAKALEKLLREKMIQSADVQSGVQAAEKLLRSLGDWVQIERLPVDNQNKNVPQNLETLEELRSLLKELEKGRLPAAPLSDQPATQEKPAGKRVLVEPGKQTAKPRLGVNVEAISPAIAEHLNLPSGVGLLVVEVVPASSAEKAGIKSGDVLIKIDGAMVPSNVEEFLKLTAALKSDTPYDVVVLRKGQQQKVGSVTLAQQQATTDQPNSKKVQAREENAQDKATAALQRIYAQRALQRPATDKETTTTTVNRKGNSITVTHQEGDVRISFRGTIKDSAVDLTDINIQNATETTTYKSLNDVPQPWRDRVNQILEMVTRNAVGKGAK
jgi:hypothetical protein